MNVKALGIFIGELRVGTLFKYVGDDSPILRFVVDNAYAQMANPPMNVVAKSDTGGPAFTGERPGSPVVPRTPPTACAIKSIPASSARGPDSPNPVIEQKTIWSLISRNAS